MKITIVGGGKVGYYLTKTLLEHGHEPTVIERDKKTCEMLANNLDIPIICGDGTSTDILEAGNVINSDALISVTGKDENNLIACQLAKKIFNVKKTVAKVNNPKNKDVMTTLGVDIAISSTDHIARLLESEVDTAKIKKLIDLNTGNTLICEIQLPENYALNGTSLSKLKLPYHFSIVSITRNGNLIIPRGQTALQSNDKILVIAENEHLHNLSELLKIE